VASPRYLAPALPPPFFSLSLSFPLGHSSKGGKEEEEEENGEKPVGKCEGGRRGCRGAKRRGKETRKEEKMEETEG